MNELPLELFRATQSENRKTVINVCEVVAEFHAFTNLQPALCCDLFFFIFSPYGCIPVSLQQHCMKLSCSFQPADTVQSSLQLSLLWSTHKQHIYTFTSVVKSSRTVVESDWESVTSLQRSSVVAAVHGRKVKPDIGADAEWERAESKHRFKAPRCNETKLQQKGKKKP
ncbi:uncharacterized protein V6R79_021396 [Siganus canaliculatus]